MTPAGLIAAAREAIGTPFRHQGRSLRGLDCAGLVMFVAAKFDIPYIDAGAYDRQPSNGLLESMLDCQPSLERIDLANIAAGAVLAMRFKREPQHLGLFTGDSLIHAYAVVGQVCEHAMTAEWRRRVVRAYRFKGMS